MTKQELAELISRLINTRHGVNSVQLIIDTMSFVNPTTFSPVDFDNAISKLIEEKEIVELRYTISVSSYRERTMYFPKGTIFEWDNK